MNCYRTIIRTILIIIFLGIFIWLIGHNLILDGHFNVETNFCDDSKFISYLYPENRISPLIKEGGLCYQKVFVEPAYFNVNLLRTFYKANVEIEYKNNSQDIINLGIMKKRLEPLDWRFTMESMENQYLDNLKWDYIRENNISLWQKEKKYSNISHFVNNLPDDKKIVVFNYNFDKKILNKNNKIIKWNKDINLSDKDYIIARYISPKKIDNNWKKANISFDVSREYINERTFEFIISAPGLTEKREKIDIRNIKVNLIRPKTDLLMFIKDLKEFIIYNIKKTLI